MNSQAVDGVLEYSTHSGAELLVLIAIAKHINYKTDNCYPSDVKLAKIARVSEKTVKRGLKKLVESGEISIVGGYGTGRPRRISVNLPRCENVQNHAESRHEKGANAHNSSCDVDIAMSTNNQMSRIENMILDMSLKILDIEKKILDIESENLDIGGGILDTAMSTEERSIRSSKKSVKYTPAIPSNFESWNSITETKPPHIIALERDIKGIVRNPNDHNAITAAAWQAYESDITGEQLLIWFTGNGCWWFTHGMGKKDFNLPYAKNVLNDMLAAKHWSENGGKLNGVPQKQEFEIMQSGAY